MPLTTSEFVTVAEAADLLRVSISTIRRWIRAGSITAHRAGQRRLLLKRADITRAMRTVEPTTNGITSGTLSPVPWDRDADPRPANAARGLNLLAGKDLAEPNDPKPQVQARTEASRIMEPETWEQIREARELRTEQLMNEVHPEFDQFDLGEVAHMIVHSPDRPRHCPLTEEEQRQLLYALEQARRTRERIRQRAGVDKFPPSEDLIMEMREERTRQLLGEDESNGELSP